MAMAKSFLAALDPDADRFTFQLFSDRGDRYAEIIHGAIHDLWGKVEALNVPERQVGVSRRGMRGSRFLAAWVMEILRKFDHPRSFGFQIASDTVLFPNEAVGGGACFVTKDEIKWMFASDWLDEQMQALDGQE